MSVPSSLVVAGNYSRSENAGIFVFPFDELSGHLRCPVARKAGIENPSYLLIHPRHPVLSAVSEVGTDSECGEVITFRSLQDPWRLERISSISSEGARPCHLQLDQTGQWLFVSNYVTGSVSRRREFG